MNRQCIKQGCTRGALSGDALHRVSPKGELFEGACTEHAPEYGVTPEPLAVLIEGRN